MDAAVPWRVRDAALLFVLAGAALILSVAGAQGLYRLQGAPNEAPSRPPMAIATVATIVCYLCSLAAVYVFVVRRYRIEWSALGLCLPTRQSLLTAAKLFGLLIAALAAMLGGMNWGLSRLGIPFNLSPISNVSSPSQPLFIPTLLASIVLAPVVEELLFRGVLYQVLRKHVGVVFGAGLSAIVFAGIHLRPIAVPEFLVLGVVLAVTFERTRSLYPSIVMHAAYNGLIVLLALRVT